MANKAQEAKRRDKSDQVIVDGINACLAKGKNLTPKQEAFCLAYIETGNASEAYRQAYDAGKMSEKVIHNKASDLLKRGDIGVRLVVGF